MREVVGEFTGIKLRPTFFWGSKTIDGIWTSEDIVVTHACVMPIGFGVDDHRTFIVNFQESRLVRTAPFRVQCAISQRLNTKVSSGATRNYVERLEKNISKHCLIEKLINLHIRHTKRKEIQQELNKLDRQSCDLMLNVERKCCRIKSGRIPFSPELALWICCAQVYKSIL